MNHIEMISALQHETPEQRRERTRKKIASLRLLHDTCRVRPMHSNVCILDMSEMRRRLDGGRAVYFSGPGAVIEFLRRAS